MDDVTKFSMKKKRDRSSSFETQDKIVKVKKARSSNLKGKQKQQEPEWPEYFHSLFKVFKALNTVLAFVSSRKQLATTFPAIRSSVENILKHPLDMTQVAELRALLPEIIKFAYVPRNEIRVNAPANSSSIRERSPDLSAFATSRERSGTKGDSEHVLVLEFAEHWKGKPAGGSTSDLVPAVRTPTATKKLVEKRNERFMKAVDELIAATAASDDPANLLRAAARAHIPVNPEHQDISVFDETYNMPIPDSANRPSVDDILTELQGQSWYNEQIVERRTVDAKEGQTAEIEPPLSNEILQALRDSRGIISLYSHQVAAIQGLGQGKDVVVSTSTASGKSVIYQVPLLRFLQENPKARAIFVYPTKALAQDQKAAVEKLLLACPGLERTQVSTYDGDTPTELRAGIRASASVIFTNFDMIHASVLPHEEVWRSFLKSLKLFVVDELHYYHGTLGSHVAQIMRRFRRVCAAIGNRRIRFVSCSATIANPRAHMTNIFGLTPEQIEVVTEDGAPSGPKDFLIWRSPYIDEEDRGMGRHSCLSEATGLMRFLMKRGVRVILFCKIRKVCELAMRTLRTELSSEGRHDILQKVQAYRGGYSAEDRRRIEHDAFTGHLLGVVATNALELGVDIGALDAVIMLGFPVTLASFRQQAGRAGRRCRDSLAVFVAEGLPIDQYYLKNSNELFDGVTDDLVVALDDKVILEAHLQCAAHEMPMCLEDEKYFGPLTKEICDTKLRKDNEGWYHTNTKYLPFPSKHVSIRGTQEDRYILVDVTTSVAAATILEEIEISRAMYDVYEGGVFMHQGKTFIVKELNHDTKIVKLIQSDVNWVTKQRDFTDVNALQTSRIRALKRSPHLAYYGRVEIFCQVFGFFKMRHSVILDAVDLESDPWIHETTGMWIDVPTSVLSLLRDKSIKPAAAIHSAQHAFINQFALGLDLQTECKAAEKEYMKKESSRKRPARMIIYDPVGKGSGTAARAFDNVSDILRKAHDVVEKCDCIESTGCAKCVLSSYCKEGNSVCSKPGALAILKAILDIEINPDSIPYETDERALRGHDSIVSASPVRALAGQKLDVESASTLESN